MRFVQMLCVSVLSIAGCGGNIDSVGTETAAIRPTDLTLFRVRTKTGAHIYTTSPQEKQTILSNGGFDEGSVGTCYAPGSGTKITPQCIVAGTTTYPNGPDGDVPFYRFRWYVDWDTPTDSHYYATNYQEVASSDAGGTFCCTRGHHDLACGGHWYEEQPPCNIFSYQADGTHPLYQLMRKDGTDHLYTTSLDEVNQAVWYYNYQYERIVGYLPW